MPLDNKKKIIDWRGSFSTHCHRGYCLDADEKEIEH